MRVKMGVICKCWACSVLYWSEEKGGLVDWNGKVVWYLAVEFGWVLKPELWGEWIVQYLGDWPILSRSYCQEVCKGELWSSSGYDCRAVVWSGQAVVWSRRSAEGWCAGESCVSGMSVRQNWKQQRKQCK